MSLPRVIWRNITGNAFRSAAVFVCAALVAGLVLVATFVVQGAEASLHHNLERLGADILVLPWGTITEKIGGIRLMSAAVDGWMPRGFIEDVQAVPGVAKVSPQLYLATLRDSPYSRLAEVYVVAYDPETDFALVPWMTEAGMRAPRAGEALAGAHIRLPEGEDGVSLFGAHLTLVGQLEPTATSIDSTLFVTFETAEQMILWSQSQAKGELKARSGTISAIMVNARLGDNPHDVAVRILEQVHGVMPLETPDLFQSERQQMVGVLRTLLTFLVVIWGLTMVFVGLVFSVAANERRWDIGVLRAIGFRREMILKMLLIEGAIIALLGGLAGVLVVSVVLAVAGDVVIDIVHLPLQFPSPLGLLVLAVGGQAVALVSVTVAAFIPAWHISHEEIALTMRV